ncbi:MAG: hypothetical protein BWY66_00094 [bacterium ADurb.Bin374]|nr:MAG: hypothetical protein BWY66_00094 [bacterium ADurb.Bin374]
MDRRHGGSGARGFGVSGSRGRRRRFDPAGGGHTGFRPGVFCRTTALWGNRRRREKRRRHHRRDDLHRKRRHLFIPEPGGGHLQPHGDDGRQRDALRHGAPDRRGPARPGTGNIAAGGEGGLLRPHHELERQARVQIEHCRCFPDFLRCFDAQDDGFRVRGDFSFDRGDGTGIEHLLRLHDPSADHLRPARDPLRARHLDSLGRHADEPLHLDK